MNRELEAIRDDLRCSVRGGAWHGTSLLEALDGFSFADAAAHPFHSVHSAWEIALHALGWIEEVMRRLNGTPPDLPERGDWPTAPEPSAEAWIQLRSEIVSAQSALEQALATIPPERLEEFVGGQQREPALGSGTTYRVMLHGLCQHNAYHAGQLQFLRRGVAPPA